MTVVRTTINPGLAIDVGPAELEQLTRYGILVSAAGTDLFVRWLGWSPDGPVIAVSGVTISIATGATVVLATTNVGTPTADGWVYRWLTTAQPGSGTYVATWTGTDPGGVTVTATETFTV